MKWNPWCQNIGGENWKAYPLRWGKEGQLFVILQDRETGQIKLSVVDETQPMEEWKCVVAPPVEIFAAKQCKFKPFCIRGESYIICLDRPNKNLIMYRIRDPNEAWETMYQEPLMEKDNEKSMQFSEHAKIQIVYCPESRLPYAIVHDRSKNKKYYDPPVLFCIDDATQPWKRVCQWSANAVISPLPQGHFRMWPVYLRVDNNGAGQENGNVVAKLETFLFVLDVIQKELLILYIPREGIEQQWHIVWRKAMAEDTRFAILYILGKQEPMCMTLSAKASSAALYKIHLMDVVPPLGHRADAMNPPTRPILEELFKRKLVGDNDQCLLWDHPAHQQHRGDPDFATHIIPVDTSADLACSTVHPWMTSVCSIILNYRDGAQLIYFVTF